MRSSQHVYLIQVHTFARRPLLQPMTAALIPPAVQDAARQLQGRVLLTEHDLDAMRWVVEISPAVASLAFVDLLMLRAERALDERGLLGGQPLWERDFDLVTLSPTGAWGDLKATLAEAAALSSAWELNSSAASERAPWFNEQLYAEDEEDDYDDEELDDPFALDGVDFFSFDDPFAVEASEADQDRTRLHPGDQTLLLTIPAGPEEPPSHHTTRVISHTALLDALAQAEAPVHDAPTVFRPDKTPPPPRKLH